MKISCVSCGAKVSVSSEGKVGKHYPGPEHSYTPTKLCKNSDAVVEESEYKRNCERCGGFVEIDDDGQLVKHYPDPRSTFSAEQYCGEHERNYGGSKIPSTMPDPHWEPGHHAEWNP